MKKNYTGTVTTNMVARGCPNCTKVFPLGDARSMRRQKERHKCKNVAL